MNNRKTRRLQVNLTKTPLLEEAGKSGVKVFKKTMNINAWKEIIRKVSMFKHMNVLTKKKD